MNGIQVIYIDSFTEKVIESSGGTHFRTKLHWIHLLLKHYWVHRVHTEVSIQNTQTGAQSRPIIGNWPVPLVGQLYICILYTSIYLYTVYKDVYNWSQISRVGLWWGHAVILIYSWIEGGSAYDRIGLWTSIYGNGGRCTSDCCYSRDCICMAGYSQRCKQSSVPVRDWWRW